ncbi:MULTISPECIES: hypothetical protein [unclassified Sphingomonas]|uniref:hypothetical protein n=1 Tax=unclassified Sphingomonas TaxID=196159 RepID=UPI000834BBDD|nr:MULTISPECIES: hypothetical protein [unclassified Sphingomonas]
MRGIGVATIVLAMTVPGVIALSPTDSARAWQIAAERPVRGTYRTTWGAARITDAPRGNRVSIQFEDGSYISIEPPAGGAGGRLLGYWLRPRRTDGGDPSGIERWARRCDRPTTQHPIATRDPRSPWWGTVLVSVNPDGSLTGRFNSCNGLPHRLEDDREGLRAWLVEPAPRVAPIAKAPLTRQPESVHKLLRATSNRCGGSPLAVAVPDACFMAPGTGIVLTIRSPIPRGQGQVVFRPIESDMSAVYRAIEGRAPLPYRRGVEDVTYYYSAPRALNRGDRLPLGHPSNLCRSDVWMMSLVDSAGRRSENIGLAITTCGPREGSFAEDSLSK